MGQAEPIKPQRLTPVTAPVDSHPVWLQLAPPCRDAASVSSAGQRALFVVKTRFGNMLSETDKRGDKMDTLLLPGQNPRAWAETMINLEARKLVNTANTVAAMHLQDGFIRIQFVDEIRAFIMASLSRAPGKTDDDCMACAGLTG
jgi:hypothetical protein